MDIIAEVDVFNYETGERKIIVMQNIPFYLSTFWVRYNIHYQLCSFELLNVKAVGFELPVLNYSFSDVLYLSELVYFKLPTYVISDLVAFFNFFQDWEELEKYCSKFTLYENIFDYVSLAKFVLKEMGKRIDDKTDDYLLSYGRSIERKRALFFGKKGVYVWAKL